MKRSKRLWLALAPVVFTIACGGGEGTNLTGPSSSIPNVAGNYSGNTTVTFPELARSVSCPTSTSVTQSGSTVSIAPLIMTGQCGNLSVPIGQATIDATGALAGSSTTTYTDPSCGTYNAVASGGFFGRDFRISMSATSQTCYNMNITITLTH
jgi:hypothetical protein